ncbi:MAG: large subunit ribosomal protein [Thermoplasmata archaeon]|jgi:large subunit ribosomal protein L12|nr:large subunit ribosomal protein [Thermoplasmata archaeon]
MEYVYSALLLHSAKKEINEANVAAVLKAAGVTADTGRVKALVAALEGADIAAAIKNASVAPVAMAAAPAGGAAAPKAEEKPEEKGVSEEEAAAGLGALFG